MFEDGVDISSQNIDILTPDLCDGADQIVLLLDIDNIESEFQMHNQPPIDFLHKNHADKLIMYPVSDPYNMDDVFLIHVRDGIKAIA